MARQSRREFLEQSLLSAAAAASWTATAGQAMAEEAASSTSTSTNEKLGVALLGTGSPNGRGTKSHLPFFSGRPDTEIVWIVDPDEKNGHAAVELAAKSQGRAPKFTRDMREAFADQAVDIVSIATPNHWHSLASIWAMQAGKDVYVEKPVSHNVSEGRHSVEAARKYNRICQAGTQSRSMPATREAMQYLHDGKLGEVKFARVLCYNRRKPIGPRGAYPVPAEVDYSLWLGPAPMAPITREQFHYNWHWQWSYGNGDLGNQGVHQMDIARWGLGEPVLSRSVVSYGGRFGEPDAGETANTQVVMYDYGDKALILELRGLETNTFECPHKKTLLGVIFYGSDGRMMIVPDYYSAFIYDKNGNELQAFTGSRDERIHFVNFLEAVRSRKAVDLNADILEGHLSSALCHLGNISYVLGKEATMGEVEKALPAIGGAAAQETFERTKDHLDENEIAPSVKLRLGAVLALDPSREEFIENAAANELLTRRYRKPFVVPAKDNV